MNYDKKINRLEKAIKVLKRKRIQEKLLKTKCLSMRKSGLSLREIGLELGYSFETIRKILKKL